MYYIVNDVDRPCKRLVAQKLSNKLYYMDPKLLPMYAYGFSDTRATLLEAFGFDIIEHEKTGLILFKQVRPSTARYPNRQKREWQDIPIFVLTRLTPKDIEDL